MRHGQKNINTLAPASLTWATDSNKGTLKDGKEGYRCNKCAGTEGMRVLIHENNAVLFVRVNKRGFGST